MPRDWSSRPCASHGTSRWPVRWLGQHLRGPTPVFSDVERQAEAFVLLSSIRAQLGAVMQEGDVGFYSPRRSPGPDSRDESADDEEFMRTRIKSVAICHAAMQDALCGVFCIFP